MPGIDKNAEHQLVDGGFLTLQNLSKRGVSRYERSGYTQ